MNVGVISIQKQHQLVTQQYSSVVCVLVQTVHYNPGILV